MRVAVAFATSLALHAGIAALPASYFSDNAPDSSQVTVIALQVHLGGRAVNASDAKAKSRTEVAAVPAVEPDTRTGVALGIPLPHYYGPREVSERAKPMGRLDLEPPVLQQFPGAGIVVLVLYISEEGAVDRVDLVSTDLDSAIEDAVLNQFRKARFAPARIDGQPVKSRLKIEVLVRPPEIVGVDPSDPTKNAAAGN